MATSTKEAALETIRDDVQQRLIARAFDRVQLYSILLAALALFVAINDILHWLPSAGVIANGDAIGNALALLTIALSGWIWMRAELRELRAELQSAEMRALVADIDRQE